MSKKVTMKDIAEKLNISINAVSLALNNKIGVSDETRLLVLKTAEQMGYLDKSIKYKRIFSSKNLCVLLKNMYFKDMYFYSKILIGIEQEARQKGYDIIVSFYEDAFRMPNCIEEGKVCGVIAVGKIEDEHLLEIKKYKIPIVLVDHSSLRESIDSIVTDNKLGAFKMTKYLIDKGYRNIGFFGDLEYSISVKERFFGYQEAIREYFSTRSQKSTNDYIFKYSFLDNVEEYIIEQNTEKIISCLRKIDNMPEVLICSNDNAAIQVCDALKNMGYNIPKDIGVVGFDDIVLCTMVTPRLTTVRVNKELMGKKAVEKLLWRISNEDSAVENSSLSVDIIERESVI